MKINIRISYEVEVEPQRFEKYRWANSYQLMSTVFFLFFFVYYSSYHVFICNFLLLKTLFLNFDRMVRNTL